MIRPVTSADRAVLRGMLAEFYDTDAVLHPLPASYHDAALDELFRPDSLQRACLLEQDGETAGYGLLSLKYSHEAGGLELWVEELYVRPAFRSGASSPHPAGNGAGKRARGGSLCPYGLFAAGLLPDVPGGSNMIYLDNAATTRPCAEAVAAVNDALTARWGNPSAVHRLGIEAARLLRAARQDVAEAMGAETERVFFTSGGTEADNWAIFSAAERLGKRGRHIVTTAVEHHAVLHPMQKLEQQGFSVTYLQPDAEGRVSLEALQAALRPDTILVTIMMVNNESGAVMPIERMARLTHRVCPNALFHTDAVQGFFKVPFRARTLGADLISVSAHKVHGIKGAGALYIRPGLSLPPFVLGGGQESGLRSGTEGLPAIAAFAAACRAALPKRTESISRQRRLLAQAQELLRAIDGVQLLGAQEAPHILNLAVPGVRSQGLINALQERDIYVSAGSACSKGHRSHVLEAMGVDAAWIDGSVRVSLSDETTEDDIRALAAALPAVLTELRGGGRRA